MSGSNETVDKEQILFHLSSITSTTNAMANKRICNAKAAKRIHDEISDIRRLVGTTMVQDVAEQEAKKDEAK